MKKLSFVFSALIIIQSLFFLSYVSLVAPNFGYMGFELDFDYSKLFLSLFLVLCLIVFISFIKDDFYLSILCLLFIFVSSPNSIIFVFMDENWSVFIWSILCVPLTYFFMLVLPVFKLPKLSERQKTIFLLSSLLLLFFFVFKSHGLHINWKVFLLQDIYELRLESRLSSSYLSVYSYFILAKVIAPVAIIYSFNKGKRYFFWVAMFILTYLFMTTGHKSVYFTPIVLLAFSFGRNDYFGKLRLLLIGTILLFLLSRISSLLGETMIESLFVRRLFYIPALLNLYFFEYFDSLKIWYSNSFLSLFLDYPLDRVPAREIGYVYYNSEDMSANNGYLSDGFANAGHFGIVFTIFITSWVYKLFKGYKVPAKYFGLVFVAFYAFQGSGLTTALITHGALLLSILIPLFLRGEKSNE